MSRAPFDTVADALALQLARRDHQSEQEAMMANADRFGWPGNSGKTGQPHRQAATQLHQNGKALVYRVRADGRQQRVELCPRCNGGRRASRRFATAA